MRSKANLLGSHPIHPMLIPFPIAFLVGAFVFDLVGRLAGWPSWWLVGAYLAIAGIATGLIAGVPGFIDYLYAVPPSSSGKKRATLHMTVNLLALASFAGAWLIRGAATVEPTWPMLGLEVLGLAFLGAGGWMGGTLVYRNQIGVDHRFADAGKWREASVEAMGAKPVRVARADELAPNQMKLIRIDGRRIVLARTEEGHVAFDDHCTHKGGSLAGGAMICGTVQCPWHGSQFDVVTGQVRAGPAGQPIATYHVEEFDGEVRLYLEEPAGRRRALETDQRRASETDRPRPGEAA
jgi:uncharacterized membrane protein/nitrite reductase/ring-hydroxylating ferredoxin subunit